MESEDYDTATVKCVVKEVTETIEFHFPDGSRGEVSFKDAARSSVLQTAMDTCREPEADVFELPDELDSNDVQAWVALTSSNLPQNDVEDIAACIMAADRLGDKPWTRRMCSAMAKCIKEDGLEMDDSVVQALDIMRPQLASSVLRHTHWSLADHISALPVSMHNLAVYAHFPSIVRKKSVTMDGKSIDPTSAAAVFNYFSSRFSASSVVVTCSPHDEDPSNFRANVEALARNLTAQQGVHITDVKGSDEEADGKTVKLAIDGDLKGTHIGKKGAIALAHSLNCFGQLHISVLPKSMPQKAPSLQNNPVQKHAPPAAIRGVKWKQYSDDNFMEKIVDWWLAKPEDTDLLQVMNAVAKKANSIVIRVDVDRRFRRPCVANHKKAMGEIIRAIEVGKVNNIPLNIYLWGRVWLERHGKPNRTNIDGGAQLVKDLFTPVLTKASEAQVLDHIAGIILVETNTCEIESSKEYAPVIVDKFNEEAAWNDSDGNPFFKTRTFMMPGAGFGLDYRNVGTDQGAFLKEMENRCGHFAFLYKYMHAAHDVTCHDYIDVDCNGTTRCWIPDMSKNAGTFSVEDRKAYLNFFGLSELTHYVETYKEEYPNATNIVFWGDCWDGISKTPPRSRQAIQELLATFSKQTGYFFNLAAFVTTNKCAQKFYLLDDSLEPNPTPGWFGDKTIADEWEAWGTS